MTNGKKCAHKRLQGPMALGENKPTCLDCGEQVPCPHPKSEREKVEQLGSTKIYWVCKWCGEQV